MAYVGKSQKGSYEPLHFKKLLNRIEVEISDDMYIITAEEAEKHLKPPVLTGLLVSPSDVQLKPGTKQTFAAKALDQFGDAIETGEVSWKATGGEVSSEGVFTAGGDVGGFLVTADAGKATGTAGVGVFKGDEPPSPPPKNQIIWEGDVPHQKWTNFYMKVLTRLASAGTLSLGLRIEAAPDGGATDAQVEEIKAALRGLSLDDDVEVK